MTAINSLELVKLELVTMFNNGITLTNIKKHLLNNGCSEVLANKLIRITEIEVK
jgi:hypothetical protein